MTRTRWVLDLALAHELRERLLAARARLLRTVATTDTELDTLEPHQPGAPVEDAAREAILGTLSRLGDFERLELDEIDAALARLEAGTLGLCEACHGQMPLPRLRAMPMARHCVACQTAREVGFGQPS